jgi:hypothetical protein
MGTCDSFLDIPPLVHWSDGSTCINPDFDMVTKFHLAAVAKDPAFPDRGLVPDVPIAPNATVEFQLTVAREENGMGHFLINELLMFTNPAGAGSLLVNIKNAQRDRTYTNASVFNRTVFGNAQLNCCLPCPIMLFPNQTVVISVTNLEAVDVRVRITARGKRFMPYHDLPLRDEMARCWLKNPSMPMWLGLDDLQTTVPADGTAQGQISIPGGGYFELYYIRGKVQPVGAPTAEDILVNVTEGRIGKRLMNEPIPLSLYMTEDKVVAGMPGGVYRSASACHCPGPRQIFRGNTRVIHDFQNLDAVNPAAVELTFVGCYHFVSACPPGADLERVRRQAHVFDSPLIYGDGAYEEGTYDGGVYQPDYECAQAPVPPPPLPPDEPEPEPLRIVRMWRPNKAFHGPGSAPAIPWQYSYGFDQHGKAHLVVRNPQTNAFVRFATRQESSGFQQTVDMYNRQAGINGLGDLGRPPPGEWERI